MSAGSRIAVEITGTSADLQKASDAAATALKKLGDVLKAQTDAALKLGDSTVKSNDAVAKSYQMAASSAASSTRKMTASYTSAVNDQVAASDRAVAAQERQAAAAEKSADAQVRANDLAASSAARAAERQAASAARVKSAFGDSSSAMTKAGKTTSLGLLGIGVASGVMAVKFESNTARIQTQAGATAKQVEQLRKGMLSMAAAVGYTPDQLADGMYHVVSSMTDAQRATMGTAGELKVLADAAKLAQVGHSNLEDTTYALVSALQALHLPLSDLGKLTGEVNATIGAGDMTMTDFVESLKSGLLPAAKVAGISLQSVGAAMAAMGDQGMRGALAGTRLRMAVALLSSPSAAAAKVLDTLGLSSREATSRSAAMSAALEQAGLRTTQLSADLRKPDGISYALEDLKKHLIESGLTATGAAAVMNKAFGGGRMGATITLLENNLGRVNSKFAQIGRGASAFPHDWVVQSHTATQQLHDMEAQAAALGTRIGTDLLPYIKTGVHDLSEFVTWLERGGTAAHGLELMVGSFAAVAVGSFFVSQIKKATTLVRDFRSALSFGGSKLSVGGVSGGGGASTLPGMGGGMGMISGARGFTAPGSIANPIVVAMEAGEYAGLSSMGASGTVGTEQKVAQAEAGATEAAGVSTGVRGGTAAAEETASAGIVASVKSGFSSALGGLLKGGLIAAGGVGVSQLAGGVIGGKAGGVVKTVGTDASIGAAVGSLAGPEGTAIGAIGGAIVGGLTELFHRKNFGDQVTGSFTKGLGGAQHKQLDQSVSSLLDAGKKLTQPQAGNQVQAITRAGAVRNLVSPTPQALAKAKQDFIKAGQETAQALEAGWNQYKFQDEPTMFTQFSSNIRKLPKDAQEAALQSAVKFSQGLENGGRLTKGSTQAFIEAVESQFPQLENYMGLSAGASSETFAKALDFKNAESNTRQAMSSINNDFSSVREAVDHTSGGVMAKAQTMALSLQDIVDFGTKPMRVQATKDLASLRSSVEQDFTSMASMTVSKMGDISGAVQSGSMTAAKQAGKYWTQFDSTVKGAEAAGLLTVQKGNQMIAQELAKALEALGVSSKDAKKLASQGFSVKTVASSLSSAAAAGLGTGQGQFTYTVGGWVGNAGEKGRDAVPAMLGRGEAVLNHPQQAIVNNYVPGGLDAVFSATTGTKHWMASGGYAGHPTLNYGQLEGLWDAGGGPKGLAPVAAAIALAESSGIDQVQQGEPFDKTGWGYWQITPGGPQYLDPMTNAREAVSKWANAPNGGHNFSPWTTYVDGRFRQFLKGGVPASASAAGVGQIMAPKVSGTGMIASIAQGALNQVAAAANTMLSRQVAISGSTAGGGAGVNAGVSAAGLPAGVTVPNAAWNPLGKPVDRWIIPILNWAAGQGWDGHITSGYRTYQQQANLTSSIKAAPGTSNHEIPNYPGGAIDVGSPADRADGQALWDVISKYPGKPNLVWGGPAIGDWGHFSATGHSGGGYVGMAGGGMATGFTTDRTKNPTKAKQHTSTLSTKNLQSLGKIGGQVSSIETDLANLGKQYTSESGRFSVLEGSPQYLNPDGSINAAGIQLAIGDNQELLRIATLMETDYVNELPLVTTALQTWLGKQSKVQSSITTDTAKITANKKRVAANHVREASIRKALLDMTRPTKNRVQTIENQISGARLGWERKVLAAERAKLGFDESSVPKELALEQAVINAQKKKLSYSAIKEADHLKQGVLSAESSEKAYAGSDHPTKLRLSKAVDSAREGYSQFLLSQSPIKSALSSATSGSELQLRQYLLTERGTQSQLADAVSNDELSERSALLPLQGALLTARVAEQKRAQRIKVESFHLRQQLRDLTNEDTRLTSKDTGISSTVSALKSVRSGASGGAVGTTTAVGVLETVATNLGTIQWGAGGSFAGIDTTGQGAAFDEKTTILQLQNTISQLGGETTAVATTDTTAEDSLLSQIATQISEGTALQAAQSSVLQGFLPLLGATEIPSYDTGGPIIGDQIAQVHDGEHVVPRGGALVLRDGGSSAAPDVHVHVHGDPHGIVSLIRSEIRNPQNVRAMSKGIGQRTRLLGR